MTPKRILVAEDNAINSEVISVMLEDFGFELLTAGDAETARQTAQDAPPDLVLLDLGLTGADALELCDELKRLRAPARLSVVLMTNNLSEEELATVKASSVDAQVNRPFSPLGLLAIVHECLQRQQQPAAS